MRYLLTTLLVAIGVTIIIGCTSGKENNESALVITLDSAQVEEANEAYELAMVEKEEAEEKEESEEATEKDTSENQIEAAPEPAQIVTPAIDNSRVLTLGTKPLYGSFRQMFGDTNGTHLAAAEAIGIEPIMNLKQCYRTRVALQKVVSCKDYYVDSLRFSMPFLVPRAAKLLSEIGRRFSDTVYAHSGARYRIKVTSVLRTNFSVSKLRRRNRNSTENSVHRYGTTFDISYSKYIKEDSSAVVSEYDMKHVLAHILKDLREKNKCYVKYEVKQSCFHITAR